MRWNRTPILLNAFWYHGPRSTRNFGLPAQKGKAFFRKPTTSRSFLPDENPSAKTSLEWTSIAAQMWYRCQQIFSLISSMTTMLLRLLCGGGSRRPSLRYHFLTDS